MAGYLIAHIDIHDQTTFQTYREKVAPLIAKFGGRYLIRGGEMRPLEGKPPATRLVVLEFPSLDAAQRFYDSPEYRPVLELRLASARSEVFLVAGYQT